MPNAFAGNCSRVHLLCDGYSKYVGYVQTLVEAELEIVILQGGGPLNETLFNVGQIAQVVEKPLVVDVL